MKHFTAAKVQFVSFDEETEEKYTLSINNLVEGADVTAISAIAGSLDTIVAGDLAHANIVENYHVAL